jgi:hypothetical protein
MSPAPTTNGASVLTFPCETREQFLQLVENMRSAGAAVHSPRPECWAITHSGITAEVSWGDGWLLVRVILKPSWLPLSTIRNQIQQALASS